jgi:hypothetical protein
MASQKGVSVVKMEVRMLILIIDAHIQMTVSDEEADQWLSREQRVGYEIA